MEAGCLEGERGAYRLVRSVEQAALPATVQAVLAARIDRLAPRDKAVLQVAAVVGKEFSATVLEHAVDLSPEELEDALRALVEGEFVYELELFPEALYAFKHPLTQEVAYRSQLADRRAPVHASVARSIAARYPDRLDERAALLAQHWEAAGESLEAARWHARAAVWSGTSDPAQALRQWGKVRDLTDAMSESPETAALGLTARVSLLDYGWRLGIPRDEAEALFVEAEQMASRAQDLALRAFLLVSHGVVRAVGDGDLREYTRRSREAIALAEESGDPALYVSVAITTYALFCTGALDEGLAICNRAIELADGDPTVGAGMAGGSGDAWCHVQKGGFLILQGELDEADRVIQHGRKSRARRATSRPSASRTSGPPCSRTTAETPRRRSSTPSRRSRSRSGRGARSRARGRGHSWVGRSPARGVAAGDRGDRALDGDRPGAPDRGGGHRSPPGCARRVVSRPRRGRAGARAGQGGNRRCRGPGRLLQSDLRPPRARASPARLGRVRGSGRDRSGACPGARARRAQRARGPTSR